MKMKFIFRERKSVWRALKPILQLIWAPLRGIYTKIWPSAPKIYANHL